MRESFERSPPDAAGRRARLQRWLAAVPIADPLERELAVLLQKALLLFLAVAVLVVPAVVAPSSAPPSRVFAAAGLLTFAVLVLLALVWVRRGRMRAGAALATAAIVLPVANTF